MAKWINYAHTTTEYLPGNLEERSIIDAIFESSQELFQPLNATINFRVERILKFLRNQY